MDDLPPPVYSVRDPSRTDSNLISATPQAIVANNAFVLVPELNSSSDLAGSDRSYIGQLSSEADHREMPQTLAASTPSPLSVSQSGFSSEDLESSGYVSAISYFEMRPPNKSRPLNTILHHMTVDPRSSPDNLRYPQPSEVWLERGVDGQDWMTFMNYLFPSHSAGLLSGPSQQGRPVDEKLAMEKMSPNDLDNQKSRPEDFYPLIGNKDRSKTDMKIPGYRNIGEKNRLRRVRIEAVATQWNAGFFEPRGLRVVVDITDTVALHQVESSAPLASGNVLERSPQPAELVETPLHRAVASRNKVWVRQLLEKGQEDLEARNKKGETPLFRAVLKGDKAVVQMLLDKGANPQTRPVGQDSMLNLAVLGGHSSIVKLLLEKDTRNVEERNKDGESPLCRSVAKGDSSMVKLLLDHGATAAVRTAKGETPLSVAVSRGDTSIVSLLLADKEIDVEVENLKGETPLYSAISRGDTSTINMLLQKGANTKANPVGKETMLNLVVSKGNTSVTNLLLQRGVDVEVRNKSGETPLWRAISRGDTSIASLLLGVGADANTKSPSGETALYRAVSRGDTSITIALLGHGAYPDTPSPSGETPLYRAVSRGDTSITSLLVGNGANLETKSPSGETPLFRAVNRSDTSIVTLLLGNGANPKAVSASGETPLEYAVKKGNKSIVQLLLSYL